VCMCVCAYMCVYVRARMYMRAVTGRLLALTRNPFRALLVFSGISIECSRSACLVEIVGWRCSTRLQPICIQELRNKFMIHHYLIVPIITYSSWYLNGVLHFPPLPAEKTKGTVPISLANQSFLTSLNFIYYYTLTWTHIHIMHCSTV
jgi:hypothetical protein